MPYYPTLAEDVARAKAILAEGRMTAADLDGIDVALHAGFIERSGTIFGKDLHAAYKLLESFVEVIEAVDVKVCELALRAQRRQLATAVPHPHTPGCTCIIVNGEYRSTERSGCPVHPEALATKAPPREVPAECLCRSCGHAASQHNARGQCESCDSIEVCWS